MSAYKQCGSILLCAMLALSSLLSSARAQSPGVTSKVVYGAIVGVVTNAAKLPVVGATVTAARVDGGGIRATVSEQRGRLFVRRSASRVVGHHCRGRTVRPNWSCRRWKSSPAKRLDTTL